MNSAWKIATIAGIPIRLHVSMVLVPLFFSSELLSNPLPTAWIITLLFASVLAHELGHVWAARRYGIKSKSITLTPIGGIAMLDSMPSKPSQEVVVAIAGPLVSLGLAASLYVFAPMLIGLLETATGPSPNTLYVAQRIFFINFLLGIFNLIPALPMDGGRVLRGLLAIKFGPLKATEKAVRVSTILAIAGFAYGLFNWSFSLMAIAVFVYLTSKSELLFARMKHASRNPQSPFGQSGPTGPFRQVWVNRNGPPPQAEDAQAYWRGQPVNKDWRPPQRPASNPRAPEVIQGGRVEVISRKDPTK